MMREISVVRPYTLASGLVRNIRESCGADGFYIYFYVCHGPESNVFGLYRLLPEQVARDLGIGPSRVRKLLLQLNDSSHLHWDAENSVVYIPEELRRQQGKHGKGNIAQKYVIGAGRCAEAHRFSPLAFKFAIDYGILEFGANEVGEGSGGTVGEGDGTLPKHYGDPTDTLSERKNTDSRDAGGKVARLREAGK